MSNNPENVLPAVQLTVKSLHSIRELIVPFLQILQDEYKRDLEFANGKNNDGKNPVDLQKVAEAEAAVALTLGSLRYISCRLSGKKTNTGLKMELDKMKKIVVRLMKKRKLLKSKQPIEKN